MGIRYSLVGIIRCTLILMAVGAVCFLYACRDSGRSEEPDTPPSVVEDVADDRKDGHVIDAPETTETTPPIETEEQSPGIETTTPVQSDTPNESAPPDIPETPVKPEPSAEDRQEDDGESGPGGGHKDSDAPPVYPEPDKTAYITIDDGPTRAVTPLILDILKDEGVRATFFVLPHSDVDDIYRRIHDEGHVIGNHSYSHKYKPLYAEDTTFFREDLIMMHMFIYDLLGYTSTLYRFPGGAMGRDREKIAVRAEILEELGYKYFDWNSSTGDSDSSGEGKNASVLAGNVLNNTKLRKQLIVLMHDSQGKAATVEALPIIIRGLREQGYAFDTLDNYE